MMNCIQDDLSTGTEEPLSSEEAASFLSTIHTLPSADYRADSVTKPSSSGRRSSSKKSPTANITYSDSSIRDARSVLSSPSDEIDEIPISICQDAWRGSDDDDASNIDNCACALDIEDNVAQDSSITKENSEPKTKEDSLNDECTLLDNSNHSRVPSYTSCYSIMTEQRDCFEMGRDEGSPTRRDFKEKTNVSNLSVIAPKKSGGMIRTLSSLKMSPLKKKEVHGEGSITAEASEDHKFEETLKIASSFSTANETESSSNSSPKASGKDAKTRSPSKFFKELRCKRLSGAAALAAAIVPVAASAVDATQREEQAQEDSANTKGQKIRTFSTSVMKSKRTETHVHLISLSPEDTPSKYDEICYGSSSPSQLTTPALPSPVDFMPHENSIIKTDAKTPGGADIAKESVDMRCDLSPIVSKSFIKRAATNDSVELDDTGIMTLTPESIDYLHTSKDSADESLSDRCRSFLSGVSRTLFPDEKLPLDNIHFEGLGDDDAFECMLKKGKSGLFDVTVEEIKSEETRLDEVVTPASLEETINMTHEKKSEQKLSSLGDVFHFDMSAFNHLFECASSSSNHAQNIVVEPMKREVISSSANDDKNETYDAGTKKQASLVLAKETSKSTISVDKAIGLENCARSEICNKIVMGQIHQKSQL